MALGGERSEVERRGRGLNLNEEEGERDQDLRVKEEEEEEEAPLGLELGLGLTPPFNLAERRRLVEERVKRWLRLRRGREGERVKAADCILKI